MADGIHSNWALSTLTLIGTVCGVSAYYSYKEVNHLSQVKKDLDS